MEKISLNGEWRMVGNGYDCTGSIPGSVYSFLLGNKLKDDPYYRENEWDYLELMNHDYVFSRRFDFERKSDDRKILLLCEGLDTLAEIKLNGKFVSATKNMHRTYEFDVSEFLNDDGNEIEITFRSPNKYVAEKHETEELFGATDALKGFMQLRKAHCMFGWDWGARLPDAGIWRDISLVRENSARLKDVRITQRHDGGKVFVTVDAEVDGGAGAEIKITSPLGDVILAANGEETEIKNPLLWWPNGLGKQNLYEVSVNVTEDDKVVDSIAKNMVCAQCAL